MHFITMLCCFLFFCSSIQAKVVIFSCVFNRPDFIELQQKLFQKFLEDDYELWVFNDASDPVMSKANEEACNRCGAICFNVPQEIHDRPYLERDPGDPLHRPNIRHCNVIQWACDNYIFNVNGPVMLIDSDMFLIRKISIEQILQEYDLCFVQWGTKDQITQKPYNYMWAGIIMFAFDRIPDKRSLYFNCGILKNTQAIVDSGGNTYFYLDKYKDLLKIKYIDWVMGYKFYCPYRYGPADKQKTDDVPNDEIERNLSSRGFTKAEIEMILQKPDTIELLLDNHILHYRAGSNYEKYGKDYINNKDNILMTFFNKILSEGND